MLGNVFNCILMIFGFSQKSKGTSLNEITHQLQGMQVEVQWGWARLRIQDGRVRARSLGGMGGFQKGMQAAEEC